MPTCQNEVSLEDASVPPKLNNQVGQKIYKSVIECFQNNGLAVYWSSNSKSYC